MNKNTALTVIIFLFLFNCINSKKTVVMKCNSPSIWKDNNGIDSCSYFTAKDMCDKIIGKLEITSKLHKNSLEKNIFNGGLSSRWYDIKKDKIIYYTPNGEIADKGECTCKEGVLNVKWNNYHLKSIKYQIHFNSKNNIELRYFDYPFSFATLGYTMNKKPLNPTKIIGIIK